MKIKDISPNRILVKQSSAEETTAGGLFIPETSREKPKMGTVIQLGQFIPESPKETSFLKEGSTVLFGQNCGSAINVEDNEYLLLKYSDVLLSLE